jgi:hypothetical protein
MMTDAAASALPEASFLLSVSNIPTSCPIRKAENCFQTVEQEEGEALRNSGFCSGDA